MEQTVTKEPAVTLIGTVSWLDKCNGMRIKYETKAVEQRATVADQRDRSSEEAAVVATALAAERRQRGGLVLRLREAKDCNADVHARTAELLAAIMKQRNEISKEATVVVALLVERGNRLKPTAEHQ